MNKNMHRDALVIGSLLTVTGISAIIVFLIFPEVCKVCERDPINFFFLGAFALFGIILIALGLKHQ